MSGRKILFVVNPSAGKKRNLDLKEFIEEHFMFPDYTVAVSSSLEYFEEIKQKALNEGYTDVIACGGDGTVNKVAAFACKHNLRLGILPLGSGNGLARSVKVSMDLKKALKQIENGKVMRIDAGVLNEKMFFCASGMGFDAHVATLFEKTEARGLWGYVRLIWREYFSYLPMNYTLRFEGKEITRPAFVLALCNSGQYGNDFYIAPTAIMNDGQITISILKPFKRWILPWLVMKVFFRKTHTLNCVETYHASQLTIVREREGHVHLDGEPHAEGLEINLNVMPEALQIIVG
jgi:YegS/Rv2252/BmrU family lipid kinase